MKPLYFILDRLNENSTWRGLILLATAVGLQIDSAQSAAIITAGLAIVGAINVFRKGDK
jgi:hypothetical protein